jgi:hypothetical protein
MNSVLLRRSYRSRRADAWRPRQPRPRHARLVPALIGLAIALLLTAAGGFAFAQTAPGRRALAGALERAVSDAIPGTMTIGSIETLGWCEPVVRDLRFHHPSGKLILLVKRATIDVDVPALLRGRVAFHRARVQGGYLSIAAQPDGRTDLEATFDDGAPRKPGERGGYLELQMRSIFVDDMTAVLRPSRDRAFRLRNVQGFVAITHVGTPGARVRLDRIAGELETPEFLGEHLTITHADGWVHGEEPQVLDLDLETQLGSGELDGHLAYYDRAETPVGLELEPKAGPLPELAALAADAQSWFTDTLDVNVR